MNAKRLAELDDRPQDATDGEILAALVTVVGGLALLTWLAATYGAIAIEWMRE